MLILTACALAACGETSKPASTTNDAPKGKLRVEYYEISKK